MHIPVLMAFLLADKVFREMETGKVHIAGTFNQLASLNFPMVHPQFYVYLALTDLREGLHKIALDIRYMETGEPVLKVEQEIQSPGPLEVIEFSMCFNRISFPKEGDVEMLLNCGEAVISSRILKIRSIPAS